jgi:hypothetical protein
MTKRRKGGKRPLIKRLDVLFSEIVRSRGHCEKCGRTTALQCAHVVTRANRRLRWDTRAAMCLCAGDHLWWHHYPLAAAEWFQTARPDDAKYVQQVQHEITHFSEQDYRDMLAGLQEQLAELKEAA